MDEKHRGEGLNIELPEEQAEGTYSNLAVIAHSAGEVVIDFIRIMPGMPKGRVKSRIIMTPKHAKRLLYALKENIDKFESMFGHIEIEDGQIPPFPGGFGGPAGFA